MNKKTIVYTGLGLSITCIGLSLFLLGHDPQLECNSEEVKTIFNQIAEERDISIIEMGAFETISKESKSSVCSMVYRTSDLQEAEKISYRVWKGDDEVIALETL